MYLPWKPRKPARNPGTTVLNSTPTSDKKPSKKFKLFGITFKNPFKKNSSKKGQQQKQQQQQRKEVIPGMTDDDIVQLIRDFERRKAPHWDLFQPSALTCKHCETTFHRMTICI